MIFMIERTIEQFTELSEFTKISPDFSLTSFQSYCRLVLISLYMSILLCYYFKGCFILASRN